MPKPKRNTYVDVLKGLLMLSVVLGHTAKALKAGEHLSCGPYSYIPYMRPFDMPLFMAIAGYFFYFSCCKRSWQEILANRFSMVFVPCVAWCWIGQMVRFGMYHHCSSLCLLPGGLWFLWSLLGCCAITVLLHKGLDSKAWIGALAVVVLMFFIGNDSNNIGYMFPFFFAGYMTSRLSLLKHFGRWYGVLSLLVFCGCYSLLGTPFAEKWMVWDSHTYLFGPMGVQRHAELYLYRMGMGFFGSIAFAWLVGLACRWCSRLPEINATCRIIYHFLLALGEYSLAVYCIQSILVETILNRGMAALVSRLGYNPLLGSPALFFALILPITVMTALLLCLGTRRVLARKKSVALILFGK